jgi:hypothetical protein
MSNIGTYKFESLLVFTFDLLQPTESYPSEVGAPKSDITVSATKTTTKTKHRQLLETRILSPNALSCRSNKILLNCITL